MNKTAKGALAAGTAAVLLMGGAGSLAYWQSEVKDGAGTVNSGRLSLEQDGAGSWTHNGVAVANPVDVVAVPGDVFVFSGATYVVEAEGDDLAAELSVTPGTATGTLAGVLDVDAVFTLGPDAFTGPATLDEGNDGNVVGVTITVDFPFGSVADNNSQSSTLDLTEYVVTLIQSDAFPTPSPAPAPTTPSPTTPPV
ncbi:alternate-type signal peptide domain-containing protein [Nocardioides marmotae]|uniref:alternate-type signal peptide domain-containing protein n=1 Tax=Nocardioides marmotae TaxID=2663857 RepID=UPI001495F14B|nr:alternate-type signal peptide domain-containing protein [Nocardioides marmotae]QKE01770.1 alternate-type signal peptide domain-containing protein [Nocardioides marmotae]